MFETSHGGVTATLGWRCTIVKINSLWVEVYLLSCCLFSESNLSVDWTMYILVVMSVIFKTVRSTKYWKTKITF